MTTESDALAIDLIGLDGRAAGAGAGPKFIVGFGVGYFGLWLAALTPLIVGLQLKVQALAPAPAGRAVVLSLLLLIGAALGIVTSLLAGRVSDRTVSRFGMRRPWLLLGAVLLAVGSIVCGTATSVPVLVLGWCLIEIAANLLLAVMLAVLPDRVPKGRRGVVSGVLGVAQSLAAVIGSILAGVISQVSIPGSFIVPGVIGAVIVALFGLVLKDRRLQRSDRPAFDRRALLATVWVNPRRYPDFGWAWWSRFAIFMAVNAVQNYQLFYLIGQLHLSLSVATLLVPAGVIAQTILVIIGSAVFGPLSDRLGRRKVFVFAAAIVAAVGLVVLAFGQSVPTFLVGMALLGAGQGIYFAVDLALVTDVLPDRVHDAAKDLGVLNLASLLPQSLAPASAPIFLGIGILSVNGQPGQNFTALFLVGLLFAVFGAVAVLRIRSVR